MRETRGGGSLQGKMGEARGGVTSGKNERQGEWSLQGKMIEAKGDGSL